MEIVNIVLSWFDGNWTIPAAIVVAYLGYRFLRAGIQIIVSIVFVGIFIALLIHVGFLPPISEFLSYWQ